MGREKTQRFTVIHPNAVMVAFPLVCTWCGKNQPTEGVYRTESYSQQEGGYAVTRTYELPFCKACSEYLKIRKSSRLLFLGVVFFGFIAITNFLSLLQNYLGYKSKLTILGVIFCLVFTTLAIMCYQIRRKKLKNFQYIDSPEKPVLEVRSESEMPGFSQEKAVCFRIYDQRYFEAFCEANEGFPLKTKKKLVIR